MILHYCIKQMFTMVVYNCLYHRIISCIPIVCNYIKYLRLIKTHDNITKSNP
nr:MAG TPA: hypothetical protein [Caudoviricetes sp.]